MKCRHDRTVCSLCNAESERAFSRLKRAWYSPAVFSSEERHSAMKEANDEQR